MNYYIQNKLKFAIVPAVIFWVVSVIFFIMGLVFDNQTPLMIGIAISLAVANTVIQVIGNDLEDEMTGIMRVGWYMSYALGIGSNVYALSKVLMISNVYIEWTVCVSLGSMIEILPEKLFVMFIKTIDPSLTLRSPKPAPKFAEQGKYEQKENVLEKIKRGYAGVQEQARNSLGLENKDFLGAEKTPVKKELPKPRLLISRPDSPYPQPASPAYHNLMRSESYQIKEE